MDPYKRNIAGVGYRGKLSNGTIPKIVDENGNVLREYTHWYGMINRCYNEKSLEKRPSYRDVCVDNKWLEFAYFYEHFNEIEGYEEWEAHPELRWHLDKDIKQQGVKNKIYGVDTCKLVIINENSKELSDRFNPNQYTDNYPVLGIHIDRSKYIIELSPQSVRDIYGIDCNKAANGKRKSAGGYQWIHITMDEYDDIMDKEYSVEELIAMLNFIDYIRVDDEARKHMSENHADVSGGNNPKAVRVYCVEYPEMIFSTMKEASGWCHGNVKQNIAGGSKSAGKHPVTGEKLHWKKYDE